MEKTLKKKNVDLEKDKQELERQKDAYHREKKRISAAYECKVRKIGEVIAEISTTFETLDEQGKISPITDTDMLSDISYISDSDTSFDNSSIQQESDPLALQRRINELEIQFKSMQNIELQDKLQKEIEGLRTSLTKIRASSALKKSLINQKKFSGSRNTFHSLTETSLTLKRVIPTGFSMISPKARLTTNFILEPKSNKSNTTTPKASSQNFTFNEIFPKESDEQDKELRKFLRVQETKLKEREENFEKEMKKSMQL